MSNVSLKPPPIKSGYVPNTNTPSMQVSPLSNRPVGFLQDKKIEWETISYNKYADTVRKSRFIFNENFNYENILKKCESGCIYTKIDDIDLQFKLLEVLTNELTRFKKGIKSSENILYILNNEYEKYSPDTYEKYVNYYLGAFKFKKTHTLEELKQHDKYYIYYELIYLLNDIFYTLMCNIFYNEKFKNEKTLSHIKQQYGDFRHTLEISGINPKIFYLNYICISSNVKNYNDTYFTEQKYKKFLAAVEAEYEMYSEPDKHIKKLENEFKKNFKTTDDIDEFDDICKKDDDVFKKCIDECNSIQNSQDKKKCNDICEKNNINNVTIYEVGLSEEEEKNLNEEFFEDDEQFETVTLDEKKYYKGCPGGRFIRVYDENTSSNHEKMMKQLDEKLKNINKKILNFSKSRAKKYKKSNKKSKKIVKKYKRSKK